MPQIYFTSDLHFGHSNILKHSPKRPYSDTVDITAHDVLLSQAHCRVDCQIPVALCLGIFDGGTTEKALLVSCVHINWEINNGAIFQFLRKNSLKPYPIQKKPCLPMQTELCRNVSHQ